MIKALADIHLERKLTHVFGIFLMVLVHHFFSLKTCWLIMLIGGLPLISLDLFRHRIPVLQKLTLRLFGAIMRRRELHQTSGTTYLLFGTAIILVIFPHNIVALSLLFLALGDPLASFVGVKYGSLKIVGKKTLEGSMAAYAICCVVAYSFYSWKELMVEHIYIVSLLSGCAGAISELIPLKIDDNFVQPVANACLLYVLFYIYGGL